MTPSVEARALTVQYGSFKALDAVDFWAYAGEIHAVVGENGAGKTTLMKTLYGGLRPTEGELRLAGRPVRFGSAAQAIASGVGMVSQHYSVIPELSCLENLMLGAEPGLVLSRRACASRADELARQMGFSFVWDDPASALSPGGAQKLEILKLLWRRAQVMILDEPTAMLSPQDADQLYDGLRRLAGEGRTVIVVTHRLNEVIQHAQRVTVLRGGRLTGADIVSGTDATRLAEQIVGHPLAPPTPRETPAPEPWLVVRNLRAKGRRGDDALKGVSFDVRLGEVLGLAGVDGNGQRELFRALMGLCPAQGDLILGGRPLGSASAAKRLELGVRLVPEDRLEEGVVEEWSLEQNAVLGLQRQAELRRGVWTDARGRRRLAERVAARFAVKHGGLGQPMRSLSGGNQQRFVAARALEGAPSLLLAFQPARGLDLDGSRQVYDALRARAREGAAALVVSFDLDELLEQCDRVLAISRGVVYEPAPEQARDRLAIGRLMLAGEARG